jgi:ribosomal protein S17
MFESKIIIFFKTAFPVLLAIFVVVLLGIFLTRIIFKILLIFARKNYQKIAKKWQNRKAIKAEKVQPKEDEALFIEKEDPLSKPKSNVVQKIISQKQEAENRELSETQIVDIVKPVGFWTSVILGQKLTYLVSSAKIMNKNSHKGFWVSMVEAQEKAQGRQKGRSL